MGTLTNSLDIDEMSQNAEFHQGLHCLLRQNRSSETELQYYLKTIICGLLSYTMDNPN